MFILNNNQPKSIFSHRNFSENNFPVMNLKSGYVYILLCEGENYYVGSTVDLGRRLRQHFSGEGANFTRKHPPISLIYFEFFSRIGLAFNREKQIQRWSRSKKEALIGKKIELLKKLSECNNDSSHQYFNKVHLDSAR